LNESAGTITTQENAPPVARWQSRQWHLNIEIGSAVHS